MESYCGLCKKEINGVSAYKTADGVLCSDCGKKCIATTNNTIISLKKKKSDELAAEMHKIYLREKNSECIICGTKLLPDNSHQFDDGGICNKCLSIYTTSFNYTDREAFNHAANKIKSDLLELKQKAESFIKRTTPVLSVESMDCFRIDKDEKKWAIFTNFNFSVYSFDDLESYSVFDGSKTATSSSNVGSAVIGGLIAGETGAIIGASKSKNTLIQDMYIEIKIKNRINRIVIPFLSNRKLEVGSIEHKRLLKTISEICNYFDFIIDENKKQAEIEKQDKEATCPAFSVADEILKFKKLLDIGAITQDEYDDHKAKLLKLL